MGDMTRFGGRGLAPEDLGRFNAGAESAESSMSRRLFPIMQYLRALGGADPNAESYRQAGFNAGGTDIGNAGAISPRPWDDAVFSDRVPGMAPSPSPSPSPVQPVDEAMALAEEIKRQKAIAAGLIPEQLWNK